MVKKCGAKYLFDVQLEKKWMTGISLYIYWEKWLHMAFWEGGGWCHKTPKVRDFIKEFNAIERVRDGR